MGKSCVAKRVKVAWLFHDDYKQEYRQLRQMFELNFIKKDEPKEARGKHIWTNYYTVPFKTNEAGEVEIEQ